MAILSERLALLIDADTRGAVRGLNQVGQAARSNLGGSGSMISQFTDGLRSAAPAIGAAAAAGAAAIYSTTQAASELSSAQGALEASFGSSTYRMREFAEGADRLGLSEANASAIAARLGGGLQALGFSAGQSASEVEKLVERAADMSVGFGTTEEALSAVSALLRGERDPIEQYGVAIKEADVSARLAAKGLDGLSGEALKNAQAVASLELLYEATADKVGLYGSEANAAARGQQQLAANVENLQAELGTYLLPALTGATGAMNDAVDIGRGLAGAIAEIAETAANAVPDIDGFAGSILGAFNFPGKGILDFEVPGFLKPERNEELEDLLRGGARVDEAWNRIRSTIGSVGDAIFRAGEATETVEPESIFSELFAYQDALQGVEDGTRKVSDAHKAHADAQRDAASAADDVRQAAIDVAEAMVVQFDATEAARRGIDDYAAAQQAATDPIFAMIRALERQDEMLKKAANPIERSRQEQTTEGHGVTKKTTSGKSSLTANDVPSLLDFAEGAAGVQQAAIGLAGALRTGETSIEKVRASLKMWVEQGWISQDQANQLGRSFEEAASKANSLEGANVAGAAAAGVAAERLEAEKEAAERTRDAQERLRSAQERLTTAQERVASTGEDVSRAHDDATRKAWALDEAQRKLNDKVAENPGLVDAAKRQMQDWVDRGLVPASVAAKDLRDMLGGINDELGRLPAEWGMKPGDRPIVGAFATGTDRVPGPMGQPVLVKAHGGEAIVSNMDLNRMRQSTAGGAGINFTVEQLVVPDAASGVREMMTELDAAAYRAGLN